MKSRFLVLPLVILALCAAFAPSSAGKDEKDAKDAKQGPVLARRIGIVGTVGVVGPQDLTPFINVAQSVELSDSTERDTMITSSAVWVNKPLYRLVKEREARVDLEGPIALTVITMMPFEHSGLGFAMDYAVAIRLDEGDAQALPLNTRRSNPLYTTRVPGMTFGVPRAFEVVVPEGKHSVYLKVAGGPAKFVFAIFQVSATPLEDQR
ncbi:MAG: hypothetical protein HZB25_12085 [Candidatus Eisenbacteria bacterium]|nr:hypothetical protein [Candidatus Eisenbacteria bacterium]